MVASPRFQSTRQGGGTVTFQEALFKGLAPDGGLYVPDRLPTLSTRDWSKAATFPEQAAQVLTKWIGNEISPDDLWSITADALDFPIHLVPLQGGQWHGVHVLELFHGPTLSFKDFGARTMARLMAHYLRDRDDQITILVATSGDTGSAVADGFAGLRQIQVVLLYPKGQVSEVQERQLIAARPGVRAFAVDGTFDDCQRLVKAAFLDRGLDHLNLSSANSINVGRLIPQMLYHIWGVSQGDRKDVTVCVPCGNLGNLTSGMMAAMSGLPIKRFLAAHNVNDYFPRLLKGDKTAPFGSIRTYSNAMDVGVPSNLERLQTMLRQEDLGKWITADSVDDASTLESMKRVYEETGYVADPHTAVGLEVARRNRAKIGRNGSTIVLATAHPAKFPGVVAKALGMDVGLSGHPALQSGLETRVESISAELEVLRSVLLPS